MLVELYVSLWCEFKEDNSQLRSPLSLPRDQLNSVSSVLTKAEAGGWGGMLINVSKLSFMKSFCVQQIFTGRARSVSGAVLGTEDGREKNKE